MKKTILLVVVVAVSLWGIAACSSSGKAIDAAHNSRNSVDWPGVYRGVLPGANSDINVEIALGDDGAYTISYQYIDKSDEVYTGSGTFKWNDAGSTITLDFGNKDKDKPFPFAPYYQVGENRLIQLDMAGEKISGDLAGMYILEKVLTAN